MASRTQRGWELTKQSLHIFYRNKQILLFPIISGMLCLLVAWFIGKPLLHIELSFLQTQHVAPLVTILGILTLLAMLFTFNVINMYCNAALIACMANHFKIKRLNIAYGFKSGWTCLPSIVGWALYNTTVGFLLRKFPQRFAQSATFASILLGTSWRVISYFVLPILVLENINLNKAIRKSSHVLHEAWGESLVLNTNLGLILFYTVLACLLPLIISIVIDDRAYVFVGLVISIFLFMALTIVTNAISNIIRTAFYLYATDSDCVVPFNHDLVEAAFCKK